jgi:glycosyltransferase involved in cell wall biosynthesis
VKIAYVLTRADAVGGASIHVRDLARGVREIGHEALVFIGGTGPVTELLAEAGVPFRSLQYLQRSIHPWRDLRGFNELGASLRAFRPDLISTHTAKAGWIGRGVARRLRIPVVYTPHGWAIADRIGATSGLVFTTAERLAARWSDAIVCVCEYERQLAIKKRVAVHFKLHVIHNGVRDVGPELRARPGASPCRLVSIARFEAPKDHVTLLRALASFRNQSWEIHLIGGGPLEREARRLTAELGLIDQVRFLGEMRDPTRSVADAQLFVLSSRSEGFPRSILEAMRAGLPVIASDVGGVPEAVTAGETGYLVEPGSVQGFVEALNVLMNNGLERQRMGSAGRLKYETNFRFERMLDTTLAVYATVVEQSVLNANSG